MASSRFLDEDYRCQWYSRSTSPSVLVATILPSHSEGFRDLLCGHILALRGPGAGSSLWWRELGLGVRDVPVFVPEELRKHTTLPYSVLNSLSLSLPHSSHKILARFPALIPWSTLGFWDAPCFWASRGRMKNRIFLSRKGFFSKIS